MRLYLVSSRKQAEWSSHLQILDKERVGPKRIKVQLEIYMEEEHGKLQRIQAEF